MDKLIAFCGLDCAGCEAYLATQAGDEAAKLTLLEKWRVEFDSPDMPLAAVTCDGCTSTGQLGGYCQDCPVRACAVEKGFENCAHCADYGTCETLNGFIGDPNRQTDAGRDPGGVIIEESEVCVVPEPGVKVRLVFCLGWTLPLIRRCAPPSPLGEGYRPFVYHFLGSWIRKL